MFLPYLSDYDPATSSEGTLDPLGLYSIANALGVRLVPGVRERQTHPRFLTAMAVGAWLCKDFDEEIIAKDGFSAPWQVYEWLFVEGIVRLAARKEDYRGLPGSMKAEQTIAEGQHLSANRYLKTPTVFGFHGVYRLLARTLNILDNYNRLAASGYELLTIWEKEQNLRGFTSSTEGSGKNWRKTIYEAIKEGLAQGRLDRSGGWQGWRFFYEHLRHTEFERQEAKFIQNALMNGGSDFRRETIKFLISEQGQNAWKKKKSELVFHKALHASGSRKVKQLLEAIRNYEEFARLLQDAFNSCLYTMTRKAGKTYLKEMIASETVENAARNIPELFPRVSDRLKFFGLSEDFEDSFISLAARTDPQSWAQALIEHHKCIQHRKPPNGKNPWIERFEDEAFIVRAAYRRSDPPKTADALEYVHAYRTQSLWSFAQDLGMI